VGGVSSTRYEKPQKISEPPGRTAGEALGASFREAEEPFVSSVLAPRPLGVALAGDNERESLIRVIGRWGLDRGLPGPFGRLVALVP
jgi:hypothetical protein